MHSQTWSRVSHSPRLKAPVAQAQMSHALPQLYRRIRVRAAVRAVLASTTSERSRYKNR